VCKNNAMKGISICLVYLLTTAWCEAQQVKIDLSNDPSKHVTTHPKSNAALLKETVEQSIPPNQEDLSKQYKPDAIGNGNSTSKGMKPANTTGALPEATQMMNTANTQYNLGNGTRANSTIYYDDAGKVRSSGTSIQFGNKKK
jgi:hypothetical protein